MTHSTEMITRMREQHKLCKSLYLIKKEMNKRNNENLRQYKDTKKLINMSIFAIPSHISILFGQFINKIPIYTQISTLRINYRHANHFHYKCLIHHKNKLYSVGDTYDDTIRIWNTETHEEIGILKGHESCVKCLVICENILYSGSSDCTIRSWDMDTCREIAVYGITCYSNFGERPSHTSSISSIALHGNKLYSGSFDKTIRIWNTETHTQIAILKDVGRVECIAVNKTKLYSGGGDNTIRIWNTETYEEMQSLEGHIGTVKCMMIHENKLYAGSINWTISIWNTETHTQIAILKDVGQVECIAVNENRLYSVGWDKNIRVWNTETYEKIATIRGHTEEVACIAVDHNILYSGGWDKTIRVWKVNDVIRKPVILEKKVIKELIKNILIRTDSDIEYAVDLWCSDKKEAILKYGNIRDWNTTQVNDMSKLFYDKSNFNDDLSRWDVSNVKSMSSMFDNAVKFNCDLSRWDVSNVKSMSYMFNNAVKFNCDLSMWDVKNVETMRRMFNRARNFDGNISTWVLKNIYESSQIRYIYEDCKISPENKIQITYISDEEEDDYDDSIILNSHDDDPMRYENKNYYYYNLLVNNNVELNIENKRQMEIKEHNRLYDDYDDDDYYY